MTDDFDLGELRLPPGIWNVVPLKIRKRRQHFVMVPWRWFEQLEGLSGQTYRVALYLLYLHWRDQGEPIKLANGMLRANGVSSRSKWRALRDLEQRGLITIERRLRKSPLIRVLV